MRYTILVALFILTFLLGFLFSNLGPIDQTLATLDPEKLFESAVAFSSTSGGFLGLLAFAPIEVRRASDINMDIKWLVLPWVIAFIPYQLFEPMSETGAGIGILILVGVYSWVIELILLFKPGQTFKDWIRSQ